jgi:polysaccharide export outer membrane protein
MTGNQDRADLEKLDLLWQRRTQERPITDYPIGPGDVLDISVPGMEELKSLSARVSSEGMIILPFIGVIQTNGLTEKSLGEEIRRRLEERYMHNPQVNLFVREYYSRKVAVLGAVANPGLYDLTSGTNTLLDMISRAGGMTATAAERLHFIPAESTGNEPGTNLTSALSIQQLSSQGSSIIQGTAPIVIDLRSLTKGGNQIYLALPARPGDVIIVPGSGEVLVEGWVSKPGSYKITPGLTVLGAVAAAGGPLFPANTSSVRIISTTKVGEKTLSLADLERIQRGESPDMPVQEGDVIAVTSSAVKMVPYSIYTFFTTAFRLSAPLY